uniref:CSON012616 protein n=1 Tax=Culicoides sonorensis TaxID=179676 RepID=A0A336KK21_CULSO
MAGEVSAEAGRLPKPQLRGLHQATIKTSLASAAVLVTITALALKFGRNEPRKRDYAEFYKTYDDNAVYERMKKAGLLQSAQD